jgi:N-acetylglucosamine malate deacetylase 1
VNTRSKSGIKLIKDLSRATAIFILQNCLFLISRKKTKTASNGPFLVIAPHPDDETLGCGAFIARARAAGQTVRIVIVLEDERQSANASCSVAEVRRQEAIKAVAALGGADDVVFLNHPDGNAATHIDSITRDLRNQVELTRPNLVLSPYGIDKHPDHRAVAAAIEHLYQEGSIACPVYEYPIWFWLGYGLAHLLRPGPVRQLRCVDAKAYQQRKINAMKAHHSQFPSRFGGLSDSLFQPYSFWIQFFARYELFFEKNVNVFTGTSERDA